jgi:hypothetical protein
MNFPPPQITKNSWICGRKTPVRRNRFQLSFVIFEPSTNPKTSNNYRAMDRWLAEQALVFISDPVLLSFENRRYCPLRICHPRTTCPPCNHDNQV